MEAWDDVTRRELNHEKIKKTKLEKIKYFKEIKHTQKYPLKKPPEQQITIPIVVKWVDAIVLPLSLSLSLSLSRRPRGERKRPYFPL